SRRSRSRIPARPAPPPPAARAAAAPGCSRCPSPAPPAPTPAAPARSTPRSTGPTRSGSASRGLRWSPSPSRSLPHSSDYPCPSVFICGSNLQSPYQCPEGDAQRGKVSIVGADAEGGLHDPGLPAAGIAEGDGVGVALHPARRLGAQAGEARIDAEQAEVAAAGEDLQPADLPAPL